MRIQTGPILGATDTSSSTVWLEWADAPEPPKLVLEGQRPTSAELIPTHPSAGVFRLSGLDADTDYKSRQTGCALLKGRAHANSAYDGEIVKDTLLSNRGYAIVEWEWSGSKPSIAVRWRVLGDREKVEGRGPFGLR